MNRLPRAAVLGLLVTTPAIAAPQAPVPPTLSLVAPNPEGFDRLGGSAVSLSDDWIVAGLPERDSGFGNQGVAYAWARPVDAGGIGVAPIEISCPDPAAGARFGFDLDLDGANLAVTQRRSPSMQNGGVVHLYSSTGSTWTLDDTVADASGFASSGFGWSVSRNGDVLAVGAPFTFVNGQSRGAVQVFRRSAQGAWVLEDTLTASDGAMQDEFGKSIAIDGDVVVVGAARKSPSGAAYAFERVQGNWVETGRFAVDPGSGDVSLGVAVDVDGDRAVVGAQRNNVTGAAYVFRRSGGTWVQEQRLQPSSLESTSNFGIGVDLAGDTLAVGAYSDSAAGALSGTTFGFTRSGGTWTPTSRFVRTEGTATSFGTVALTDGQGRFVSGAPADGLLGGVTAAGALFVHDARDEIGTAYCSAAPNSTGRTGVISAWGRLSAAANEIELVSFDLPRNAFGYFLASRASGFVTQPGGSEGNLCLGGAIGRYVGAGQIANSGATGSFSLPIDLTVIPQPNGPEPAVAGETWHFQTWFRDSNLGIATSNFSQGVRLVLE
ncbi:MAG: hypothetical protein AAF726_19925 [Planctomycetota bacterium]